MHQWRQVVVQETCKHLKDHHRNSWPPTDGSFEGESQRLDAIIHDDKNTWEDWHNRLVYRAEGEWAQISWPAMEEESDQMLVGKKFGPGFEFDPKLQREDVPQESDVFAQIRRCAQDDARRSQMKARGLPRGSRWYN